MKRLIIIILGISACVAIFVSVCFLLYSNSSGVLYDKGMTALYTGKYDDAQKYLLRVVDKNDSRRPDAYYALAVCNDNRGDTVATVEYLRLAALDLHSDAISEYLKYLDERPQLFEQYVNFISEMHERNPGNCSYVSRLAKLYLFGDRSPDRAGKILLPFINQSGSDIGGADVTAKALAAYMLLSGSGGYVESPEAALILAKSCRNYLAGSDFSKIDGDALFILGKLELIALAYTPEADILDNLRQAKRYFEAIQPAGTYTVNPAELHSFIKWLDEYLDEASRVQHSPNWWDRKPNDWTSFFNRETGFRYKGHTNGSGNIHYNGYPTEYPLGWGCGVWTRGHYAAVGKWGNGCGQFLKGIYVYPSGIVELRN